MSVRLKIFETIEQIAAEQGKKIVPLQDNVVLIDSGLDSLCFAILVARLEDELGIDPFSAAEEVYFPRTVGDFVELYDRVPA
jgi:acyl carrier protein